MIEISKIIFRLQILDSISCELFKMFDRIHHRLGKKDLQQTKRLDMQSLTDDCPGNVNIITTEGSIQALEYAVVRRI